MMDSQDLEDFLIPKYIPKCGICYVTFNTTGALINHYTKIHHKKASYQCQLCSKELTRKDIYYRHFRSQHLHGNNGNIPDPVITYTDPPPPKVVSSTLPSSMPKSGRTTLLDSNIPQEQFLRKSSKTKVKSSQKNHKPPPRSLKTTSHRPEA